MGKKLLCLITAIMMLASLCACGGNNIAMDTSNKVDTANGGFVAETEKYVYFINGVENYTTAYKTGKVTKGALMRTEKSNLANLSSTTKYDTVVSKLIVSDDKDAGFYIYGDYVYYAVPSTENDKTGAVKNDQLNFFRTKLDASNTSKNITGRDFSHSAKFRYVQSGNNVYLVVYSTDLYVYDANTGKELYTTELGKNGSSLDKVDVAEVVFAENNNGASVYFTSLPINKALSDEENPTKDSYHVVYQVSLGANSVSANAKIVLDGIGTKTVGNDGENAEGVDTLGVTVDLLRYVDGTLYFSYTSLNTAVGTVAYMAIPEADFAKADWKVRDWVKADYRLTLKDKNSASVFADTSLILDKNTVLYTDATYGLLVYNYAKASDADSDFGVSIAYTSDAVKGATLAFVNKEGADNFLYYYDSSKNFYKLNLTKVLAGEDVEEFRVNKLAIDTTWYLPEVVEVNGNYYMVAAYSDATYESYCYLINMTQLESEYNALETDEEKDEFYTVEEMDDDEFEEFLAANILGVREVVEDEE